MNVPHQLLFLLIATNAGGEGKTLLARLLKSLLLLGGEPVETLDGDQGNAAATQSDPHALRVGWGVDAIKASAIGQRTFGSHVIVDLGANTLASAREIVDLLPALRSMYVDAGYRAIAFLPVSTNKVGAVGAIKHLEPKIEGYERFFVKNNRDGSGNFEGALDGKNVLALGHLPPGFQSLVRGPGNSFAETISSPPKNHEMAALYIAGWMRSFAGQDPVRPLFAGGSATLARCDPPPGELRFRVQRLEDTTDSALVRNVKKSKILSAIDRAGWTAEGLRQVASEI